MKTVQISFDLRELNHLNSIDFGPIINLKIKEAMSKIYEPYPHVIFFTKVKTELEKTNSYKAEKGKDIGRFYRAGASIEETIKSLTNKL